MSIKQAKRTTMAQGTQAKIITRPQERAVLAHLQHTRNPQRDRVLFLLSLKAGLRAKEIAGLTWGMVTDATGRVADAIALPDTASKGTSGRTVYLHPDLRAALEALHAVSPTTRSDRPVIYSTRNTGLSAAAVAEWFARLYRTLRMDGCSSHSGRRTFITRAAKAVSQVGGSLRDVQQLAGHASLAMTQAYIEGDTEAKRQLVRRV
jgi:integrase/recombinase XerD